MCGRPPPGEQARRRQHQRAAADRSHVSGALGLVAQEGQDLLVLHQGIDAHAAGHPQHVELRAVVEGEVGHQNEAGGAVDALDPLPDQPHLGVGGRGEDS